MKTQTYKGYTIRFSEKKNRFEAKKGRKMLTFCASEESLKRSIDSWVRNIECSRRIDATPQGKSPNPNVRR